MIAVVVVDATIVAVKNVVGGNFGKTKIVVLNATSAMIAVIS